MKKIKIKAPAKINLYLLVLAKLNNGYHELETLMAKINLFDDLFIELNDKEDSLNIINNTGQELDSGFDLENNLCLKAVNLFRKEKNIKKQHVNINLTKNIPFGAGLGGGSSDAAAVLLALNSFLPENEKLTNEKLSELALKLGADVPFFINPAPVLFAQGIGEKLINLNLNEDFFQAYYLLIIFKNKLSTKEVFKNFCLTKSSTKHNMKKIDFEAYTNTLSEEKKVKLIERYAVNNLTETVFKLNNNLFKVEELITKTAPYKFALSGSGPSFWLSFKDKMKFEKAIIFLKNNLPFNKIKVIKILKNK